MLVANANRSAISERRRVVSIPYEELAVEAERARAIPDSILMQTPEAVRFMAAHGYQVAELTLVRWRCARSDGPEFQKLGRRAVYSAGSLRAFLRTHGVDA